MWIDGNSTKPQRRKKACGTKGQNRGQRKATVWWNDEVKEAVKEKKKTLQCVKSQTHEDYVNYRLVGRNSKRVVKTAKDSSWTDYGRHLTELCKQSPREFYRSIRAIRLRDGPYNPVSVINDKVIKDGNPLYEYEDSDIRERWEDYFRELLNPVDGISTSEKFKPRHPEHKEPNKEEVKRAVRSSPKNKAAGVDRIITEAITACGETGIKWLTTIFQKAWEERRVPDDWQRALVMPIWKRKGSKKDCNKYRGISLLSHTGKIFTKILEQRTRAIIVLQAEVLVE
ncbi:uncharacterized protein [Branchiostoma lanceolatum]|uniref:uncharacterized protein n=1 Tax=Branchiostoma lanceolatum TaxID=7740 RepID=UPI003451384B